MSLKTNKQMPIRPEYTKVELRCSAINSTLIYFEKRYGKEALEEFVEKTGMSLEYLKDTNNWISYDYWKLFLREFVNYAKDPKVAFDAGLYTAQNTFGPLWFLFRTLGRPELMYKKVAELSSTFNKICKTRILEISRNRVVLEAQYFSAFEQDINNCLNIQGSLASVPMIWGLPIAHVKHSHCQAMGAPSCIYEFSWYNAHAKRYPLLGLIGGLVLGGVYILLGLQDYLESPFFALVPLLLLGYLVGRCYDSRKVNKDNLRVHEEQNQALLESIGEIEKLNVGLQRKVEERTEQLRQSNQELTKAYDDLKTQELHLIQSEKMAGLGRLVAGIAHELNTPAGVLQSAAHYNISHIDEMVTLFNAVEKIVQDSAEDRFAFLAIIEDLVKDVAGSKRPVSLKDEERLFREIKEGLGVFSIPDLERLSRILAEFGILGTKDIARIGKFVEKYPQAEVLQCFQVFGRHFSNIKTIELTTGNVARLVKALRVYSRLDEAKREEVDLHEEIEVCLTILKGQIENGIRIRKSYGQIPKVTCAVDELNQVWTNLILNAIQALNGQGEVAIETFAEGDEVHVKVMDSGPGISPEILPKIFDPFFTTKPPGEGSGLGLGICQQIVQKHHGQIKAESQPGRTCIEVILPTREK